MSDREQQQESNETTNLLPTTTHDSNYQGSQRKGWKYYFVWFWRFCIFGITGSSSIRVTQFILRLSGCPSGTWYYYVAFFFAELAVYTTMIVIIGTLLFQWQFFCLVAFKMWSWLLPKRLKAWCHEHLHSHRITL